MTRSLLVFLLYACCLPAHAALDAAQVRRLAAEAWLVSWMASKRQRSAAAGVFRVEDARVATLPQLKAATGSAIKTPDNPESVTVNNRIRGELASALAALKLFDEDPLVRLASAQKLQSKVSPEMAPLLARAPDHVKAGLAASVPYPKRLGRPEEYASLAEQMITNGYFNGESVRLDGAIRMAPR